MPLAILGMSLGVAQLSAGPGKACGDGEHLGVTSWRVHAHQTTPYLESVCPNAVVQSP